MFEIIHNAGVQHLRMGISWCSTEEERGTYDWTDDDRPIMWLAECGMAAVYRLGGWDSLLLLTATALAGIYTWVGRRLLFDCPWNFNGAVLDVFCCLTAMSRNGTELE